MHFTDREEGVLKDVLDELDRERSRRAELEDQVRKLHEEAAISQQQRTAIHSEVNHSISHQAFVSMETQLNGFQQIVDAITLGKPAIAAAAAAERSEKALYKHTPPRAARSNRAEPTPHRKTLPLHVVRLLEVLPWDPRVKQHIFVTEEVFEWQVFREKAWQHQLRFFPTAFKTLPIVKAEASSITETQADSSFASPSYDFLTKSNGMKENRSFLSFLAGSDSQQRLNNRIFTNERLTTMYNLDNGYPLPKNDGCVWEWVGGWRINSRSAVDSTKEDTNLTKVDSGQDGWSYAVEPGAFIRGVPDMIWDNSGAANDQSAPSLPGQSKAASSVPVRTFRRRRWMRQRALVDYLHASESSRQFLRLLAENAKLSVGAGKICDQLIETKLALTEAEEKLSVLSDTLQRKEERLKVAGIVDDMPDSRLSTSVEQKLNVEGSNNLSPPDVEVKSAEVPTSVQKQPSCLDGTERSLPAEIESHIQPDSQSGEKFDWKKIGRGAILNKLKPAAF
jgi:hypothetical protein